MTDKKQIVEAILLVQQTIRWKPGSLQQHLRTRIRRRHLPNNATVADYEAIIQRTLSTNEAKVYLFSYDEDYPTIVTLLEEGHWLVMFSLAGIMETAFVVERPEAYLSKPNVRYIGTLQEVLK